MSQCLLETSCPCKGLSPTRNLWVHEEEVVDIGLKSGPSTGLDKEKKLKRGRDCCLKSFVRNEDRNYRVTKSGTNHKQNQDSEKRPPKR